MELVPSPELLVHSSFDDTAVRRACLRGDLVRLVPGRYVRAGHWDLFDKRERYLMLSLAALSALRCDAVLSHSSAAAFWKMPRLGDWPDRAHATNPSATTSTADRWMYKHALPLSSDDVVEIAGIRVTTPARTAVDLAVSQPFRQAVVMLDHCLHADRATKPKMLELLDVRREQRGTHGTARARRAITFADARADGPGESLSRVVMHENDFEPPDLQPRFENSSGPDAYPDFAWKGRRLLGEFDGEVKYRSARMRAGRSPEQVVIDEKNRENWLARQPGVEGVIRWDWRTVVTPGSLTALLSSAGVPRRVSRASGR